jgi:hypothetical protein
MLSTHLVEVGQPLVTLLREGLSWGILWWPVWLVRGRQRPAGLKPDSSR